MLTTDWDAFKTPVYGLRGSEKSAKLLAEMNRLTAYHAQNCEPYRRDLEAWGLDVSHSSLADVPYLPVRLFKAYEFVSVPRDQVVKVLTSSGTTSQAVSRIFLDALTARYQQRALVSILQEYLGKARMPMLIVDHPNVIADRQSFSARGAGISGLSNFGRDHTYLLNEEMQINFDLLDEFLKKHEGGKVLVFGFTFMVWQYLIRALERAKRRVNIGNGVLIHSGGWKKLQDQAVDNTMFKRAVKKQTGIGAVHNFYGMVEQVGSIFVECEHGHLHAPVYADVLIRDLRTLEVKPAGESGVIQVMSILPHSYPGHNLLTEDIGVVLGEDDCPCGRLGKYFHVQGRILRAEIRGCSDTHAHDRES